MTAATTERANSVTIYWHRTGPLMKYTDGVLQIEDLNPQRSMFWRVKRLKMIGIGLRFILAGIVVP